MQNSIKIIKKNFKKCSNTWTCEVISDSNCNRISEQSWRTDRNCKSTSLIPSKSRFTLPHRELNFSENVWTTQPWRLASVQVWAPTHTRYPRVLPHYASPCSKWPLRSQCSVADTMFFTVFIMQWKHSKKKILLLFYTEWNGHKGTL